MKVLGFLCPWTGKRQLHNLHPLHFSCSYHQVNTAHPSSKGLCRVPFSSDPVNTLHFVVVRI